MKTDADTLQPLDLKGMRRIAVFRALQLGDLLCTVPALRALRAAAPQAEITLIGLPWATGLARRFAHYLDDFLAFPGYPGLPEIMPDPAGLPSFFAQAHARRFDLALQLHGSGIITNPLVAALAARINAGCFIPGHFCPDSRHFATWSESEHEVLRYPRVLARLGIPAQGDRLEFPLYEEDYSGLLAAGIKLPAPGRYACIHPGARLPSRRWPPRRFAEVADGLAAQGLRIVITGSESERALTQSLIQAMRSPAIDMTGRTRLGELAALIAQARLLVCNDTGVSHIAAAVATPSVVVCCGADPGRWAPLDRQRHRVLHAQVLCRPCAHVECPIGHPCAQDIFPEAVIAAAGALPVADAARRSILP